MPQRVGSIFGVILPLYILTALASGQVVRGIQPGSRIQGTIDDSDFIRLTGNRHPLVSREKSTGVAEPGLRMERMILSLHASAEKERYLESLIEAQQNPLSEQFHQWLTPENFAERFGAGAVDISRITAWLSSRGFEIDEIPPGGRSIIFSGTAGQVEATFRTQINLYRLNGRVHHANASDPTIPAALADVVGGIVSLNDLPNGFSGALRSRMTPSTPELTMGGSHFMAPADFATVYNLTPLYASGDSGEGQAIAVASRSNIKISDVASFRAYFGLTPNPPVVIVNGADPGIVSQNEQLEAVLDTEWAGAVAPGAKVNLVVSASTAVTDGATLSAQYIVSHNLAPVVLMAYGVCEKSMGTAARDNIRSLWQQAAAQGMTVVVSAGDSGAAGCDGYWQTTGTGGAAVNGFCSTPWNVCVGGTQFTDTNSAPYWSGSNAAWGQGSALQYIPEVAWNESGVSGGIGLYAGGGGRSAFNAKPAWQRGPGVPGDGQRDVPDVSLAAGMHDGYVICANGTMLAVNGTSGAAAAFSGIVAMLDARTAMRQGNISPNLYSLAAAQTAGGPLSFHDVQSGNNSVPGVNGNSAGVGYDLATGLGSIDANILFSRWSAGAGSSLPAFTMTVTPAPFVLRQTESAALTVNLSFASAFRSSVAITVTGAPDGVQIPSTATISSSGSVTLTLSASAAAALGSFPLTMVASGGSVTASESFQLIIAPPSSKWTLVWSDEFDGAAGTLPDASKWALQVGGGGWGNQELETYTNLPENVHLDGNGHLLIHVESKNGAYTSARVLSQGRYSVQYGRIETRAVIPAGSGLWPGFWMLGANCESVGWPLCGEVDILENKGSEPSINYGSVHGPGYSGGNAVTAEYALANGQTFTAGFHVFAVEWSPQAITFLVDGAPYQTVTPAALPKGTQWVFDNPFYLLMNVAVGGNFAGAPDPKTQISQDMVIDYVKVYKAGS
ncbi:MAG: protease pro-enzyme activation domain-containing protein [Terriglobia bacterium]